MDLRNKVIVIAGAGGKLGSELTAGILGAGPAGLVLGDLVDVELPTGAQAVSCRTDVREPKQVDALVDLAVERFGRVDVMINNAGIISPNGRIHNLSDDDWQAAISVNLFGAINGVRSAVRAMRSGEGGSIVNTASVAGLTAWSHAGPYCVTKAAVIQLTKVAAVEYARDGIRVNSVCPGVFPSAMHKDLPAQAMTSLEAKHPLGFGSPEDLVGAYLYLASDLSRWTTGTAMVVDGGYAAP
jgi:meso-butanediol dehydrogenase / (S,S)-butanediol dehydrogenase / diacetyl reductase